MIALKLTALILLFLFFIPTAARAQDSAAFSLLQQGKLYASLSDKASSIDNKLDKATEKYLSKLEKQEAKLRSKVFKKDSLLAKQLFNGVEEKYESIKTSTQKLSNSASVYSGHLDSLTTGLRFLQNNPLTSKVDLQKQLSGLNSLQDKLNQTEIIKKFIAQRRQLLRENLERLGMLKQFKGFQKQAYYYQMQVFEIKSLWESPEKLEKRLLEEIVKLPQFKEFFARNSMLGSLFALPGGSGNASPSLAGLQTRASVMAGITQRFGSGAGLQQIQQNFQSAQAQLSELKSKIASLGSGSFGNSSGDVDLPKGFRPNNQKTKSFKDRLEMGADFQSQKASNFLPQTNDLGLSLGYRISDRFMAGIGSSMKIGLGKNWNNLRLSFEGVGLRSYIAWKLQGSIYVSGGYEQNYRNAFSSIELLKNYSAWSHSGLLGLAKRYSIGGKKLKGEMKLLWDFMSDMQVPRTSPLVFRIGYSLK